MSQDLCEMRFRLRRPAFRRWTTSGEAPEPNNVMNLTANKLTIKFITSVRKKLRCNFKCIGDQVSNSRNFECEKYFNCWFFNYLNPKILLRHNNSRATFDESAVSLPRHILMLSASLHAWTWQVSSSSRPAWTWRYLSNVKAYHHVAATYCIMNRYIITRRA